MPPYLIGGRLVAAGLKLDPEAVVFAPSNRETNVGHSGLDTLSLKPGGGGLGAIPPVRDGEHERQFRQALGLILSPAEEGDLGKVFGLSHGANAQARATNLAINLLQRRREQFQLGHFAHRKHAPFPMYSVFRSPVAGGT
jgi:uncharacterized protein (DUF1501 family)